MSTISRHASPLVLVLFVVVGFLSPALAQPGADRKTTFGDAGWPQITARQLPVSFSTSLEQAATQPDPTNVEPVEFVVTFGAPIDVLSFSPSDIVQTGSATVATWIIGNAEDPTSFVLRASGIADGTIVPAIPAGAVQDGAGNSNQASISIDNSVTFGTFACNTLTYLYVAIWSPAKIRAYCVESDGSLTFESEIDAPGDARDMQISANGRSLYYAHSDLTRYTLSTDGSLVPSRTRAVGDGAFDDLALDPAGRFLYGTHSRNGGRVYVFDVSRGSMPVIQMVTGFHLPHGLALDPGGQYLYVANYFPEEIYAYPLLGDGTLDEAAEEITDWVPRPMYFAMHPTLNRMYWTETAGGDTLAGTRAGTNVERWDHEFSGRGARAIAIEEDGSFVYVANNNDDDVTTFRTAPTGGLIPRWQASTARRPEHLLLHPDGDFLYVASAGDDGVGPSVVSSYSVATDGWLTPLAPVVIPDQGAYRLAIVDLTAP